MNRRDFVSSGIGLFFLQNVEATSALPCKRKILLQCRDLNVLHYFRRVVRWLNLEQRLNEINDVYKRFDKAFVHLDMECCICGGSAIDPETNKCCNHPNGTIHSITILRNEFIVKSGSSFALIPDQEIYDRCPELPDEVKTSIVQNGCISLSNRTLVVVDSSVGVEFVEEKVFRPIAQMQGFVDDAGEDYYPKVTIT